MPDLPSASLPENSTFGVVLTMVTTKENPQRKTFVHVNNIKYDTNDAIEINHGSIFIPLTELDISKCEKT